MQQYEKNMQQDQELEQNRSAIRAKFTGDYRNKQGSEEGAGSLKGVYFSGETGDQREKEQIVNETDRLRHQYLMSLNSNYKFISLNDLQIFKS